MVLPSAHNRECTAESAPVLPPRPAVSVPTRPPAAADQIRRRFEDQRRPPGPRVADSPPRVANPRGSPLCVLAPWRSRTGGVLRVVGRLSLVTNAARGGVKIAASVAPLVVRGAAAVPLGVVRRVTVPHLAIRLAVIHPRADPQGVALLLASASDFARALERLPDVLATALRESQAAIACRSVPPDAPRSLPAIVEVANRAVSPPRSVQQPPVLPGFVGAGGGPARGPYRDPRPRLEEAEYSCSTATLRQLWILSECLEALARVLRSTRASMPISRPSTFAEKPQAACLGAADEILSLLAPLQAAPSPGADAANLLARAALDLRHIAGSAEGTPGDALTACVSVVRHLWQTTRAMLSFLGADRM
ncbi:unnamed protein product [Closterium sp. NIES-64]|nr:unnamed protein product [Closterium sp. NIES-64]